MDPLYQDLEEIDLPSGLSTAIRAYVGPVSTFQVQSLSSLPPEPEVHFKVPSHPHHPSSTHFSLSLPPACAPYLPTCLPPNLFISVFLSSILSPLFPVFRPLSLQIISSTSGPRDVPPSSTQRCPSIIRTDLFTPVDLFGSGGRLASSGPPPVRRQCPKVQARLN